MLQYYVAKVEQYLYISLNPPDPHKSFQNQEIRINTIYTYKSMQLQINSFTLGVI